MSSDLLVRPYQPGDEEGINSLFNQVFNLNRSLSQWQWEFTAGPVSRPELSVVAEDRGRVVGFFGSLFHRLQIGNRILLEAYGVDNAIHPSFRGGFRGLQYRLWQEQRRLWVGEGIPIALGFPNREAYIIGRRVLKYRNLMDLAIWHRRLNPRIGLRTRIKNFPSFLEKAIVHLSGLWNQTGLRIGSFSKVKIRAVSEFPPEINLFWERFRKLYPVMLVRDQAYLNWRYAPQWGRPYQIWLAWSGDNIVGMAVGGMLVRGPFQERLGLVMEFAGLPPFQSFAPLLRSMLLWFVKQQADGALARMSPVDPIQRFLRSFGFRPRQDRFDFRFAYHLLLPEEVDQTLIFNPKSWYTTLGDSDAI